MTQLRTIKAVPNYKKRTYTLYTQENGKTINKYRTIRYTLVVFYDMLYYTQEDWRNLLKRGDEYTVIK